MGTALPTIMRTEGVSLQSIMYMSLVSIPIIVRFLWAPLVDRYGKYYFSWVTVSTVLYALFFFPAMFLNVHHVAGLACLFTLSMICMSFQDIAMDAFAISVLSGKERSIGNGIQTGGNYLGLLLGGGILLLGYERLGWRNAVAILSLLTIFPVCITILYSAKSKKEPQRQRANFKDLVTYFKVKEFRQWIVVLMFLIVPVNITLSFSKLLLIDNGFSLAQSGYMVGILGGTAMILSGFAAGWLFKGTSMTVKLMAATISSIVGVFCGIVLVHIDNHHPLQALTFCVILGLMVGVNMMIVNDLSMKYVRPGREGVDYSIQQFFRYLIYTPLLIISGAFVEDYGYTSIFLTMLVTALVLGVLALSGPATSKSQIRGSLQ